MTAPPDEALERLLHRAHRDELLPLAKLLGVTPDGLGLGDLARSLASELRRVASNGLGNAVLRRGVGRPYADIVADAARAIEPGVGGTLEEQELAVARHWFGVRWDASSEAERARLWAELGGRGEPPRRSGEAVADVRARLGRSADYALTGVRKAIGTPIGLAALSLAALGPVGCLLRPVLLLALPWFAWRAATPSPKVTGALLHAVARIRQTVVHRITIGVVGSPSTGKDAAIRALFGIDTGDISPIAGSTRSVGIHRLPGATALYVVNTPGMGDVVEQVTEEARQVLDHIDVFLYLVNAEGGVQARELADYQRCVGSGRPVLALVNKVDVLRPRDRDRFLDETRARLGASAGDFLAVACDPLPELAPGPIGLDAVYSWLTTTLEALGKDPGELPPLPSASRSGSAPLEGAMPPA